jgi:hypothetical protein
VGIDVSAAKVVTINDHHENAVDTSVDRNPTRSGFKGIPLLHVFSRNQMGPRRDDGNPLVHALKGRRGFTIMPYWKNQLLGRAKAILAKVEGELKEFDFILPIPSSSPFCGEFADLISEVSGVPVLPSNFLRKRLVGELLAENQATPPKMRAGLKQPFAAQMYAWGEMDPAATYQAKDIDLRLRLLFRAFDLEGDVPDIAGKRILVVDDIFASGSSLSSVRDILQGQLGATAAGICFLSGS